MNKYMVTNLYTGRQFACIYAKSLHAAKCYASHLWGFDTSRLVYAMD